MIFVLTKTISAITRAIITNSSGLSSSIITMQPTRVSALERNCTRLCSSIICTLSKSLVKRLISSPWVWVSKYFSSRSCILSNRSRRMVLTVRWESCTFSRIWP